MDNSNIYEEFDWSKLNETHLRDKINKIFELIPNDVQTIVDIGCGNGAITNVLGKKFKITGVDRSMHALGMVSTNKIQASSDNIPLLDNSFDMVFSSELLEHLTDEVLSGTIREIKRLSKKYVFITVPNDENPDKLSIRCPKCKYIYNSPNHLRSFTKEKIIHYFKKYKTLKTIKYGKKVRYYNTCLLKQKLEFTPHNSWIPYYWMPKNKRKTICPNCENKFENRYKFNLLATIYDLLNVIISPKKPYWLFVLMEKK